MAAASAFADLALFGLWPTHAARPARPWLRHRTEGQVRLGISSMGSGSPFLYRNSCHSIEAGEDGIDDTHLAQSSCMLMGGADENSTLRRLEGAASATPEPRWSMINFIRHLGLGQFSIYNRPFAEPGMGMLYSTPHPAADGRSNLLSSRCRGLIVGGTDEAGIERAGRLLPIGTVTLMPEWIVVGAQADRFGGCSVLAAG